MRVALNVAVALAIGAGTTAAAYATAGTHSDEPPPALGPDPVTVVIDAKYSRFEPSELRVVEGTKVRFVVVNGDPINHELIVGPPEVHDAHRDGTDHVHPPLPGEVSVGPTSRAVTSYVFDEPGIVEMGCHLPGHYDYGMHGEIEVVPAR